MYVVALYFYAFWLYQCRMAIVWRRWCAINGDSDVGDDETQFYENLFIASLEKRNKSPIHYIIHTHAAWKTKSKQIEFCTHRIARERNENKLPKQNGNGMEMCILYNSIKAIACQRIHTRNGEKKTFERNVKNTT